MTVSDPQDGYQTQNKIFSRNGTGTNKKFWPGPSPRPNWFLPGPDRDRDRKKAILQIPTGDTSILIQFSLQPLSFLYDCLAYGMFYHVYSSLSSVLDCISVFSIPVKFELMFMNDYKIRLAWYITSSSLQFSIIFVNSYVEHSIYHLYSSLSTFPNVFNSSSISSTSESSRAFMHFCLFHHLVRECLPCCITVWLRNRKWFALFSFTIQLRFSRH
jgi:hypothetical protein